MNASAHVAAGIVAGMVATRFPTGTLRRVGAAFSVGVLSHVVLDAIPHSDYRMLARSTVLWVSACEIVGTMAIAAWLLRRRLTPQWQGPLVAGLAGACLPDAKFPARLLLPAEAVQRVETYGDSFHGFFHAGRMANPMIGLGIEIAFAIALLLSLSAFPRTSPASSE